jgi:hypothetical protein
MAASLRFTRTITKRVPPARTPNEGVRFLDKPVDAQGLPCKPLSRGRGEGQDKGAMTLRLSS